MIVAPNRTAIKGLAKLLRSEASSGTISTELTQIPYFKGAPMVRNLLTISLAAVVLCLGTVGLSAAEESEKKSVLRHVVVFKFKEDTQPKDIKKVEKAFAALPEKIKEIKDFEWGTNNSPEGLNDGFTHCFLVTFASEEAREAYLPHPAHKEFVGILRPHLEKAFVIDYWSKK